MSRLPPARRTALAAALLLALAGCGERPAGSTLPLGSTVTADSSDGAALRAAFEQGAGKLRIVALLSPT